jgi:catechol 2,3-dioxygenase-like lactoylglutathione lyase family enzyme
MSRPAPVALDHVQLLAPADGAEEARGFYGVMLGLPEIPRPEALPPGRSIWFACGAQQLHVRLADGFRPETVGHPGLRLEDGAALEELAGRLAGAGAPVRWDESYPGRRRFFTEDPFGNRLELLA